MKRPLGVVSLFYGGGLLLAEFFQPPLLLLFAASFAVMGSVLLLARVRPYLLAFLLVLTGWTNLVFRTAAISPHDLRLLLGDTVEEVAVRGSLCETPVTRGYLRQEKAASRTMALLQVAAIKRGSAWQPAEGRIAVTTSGELPPKFFAGQEVLLSGVVQKPPLPLAEGLFDYRAYLNRKGIHYQLQAAPSDWRLISNDCAPPWSDCFRAWAQATLSRGLPELDEPLRLLWSMTLGWKSSLPGEVYEPFIQSGTMHLFAISGLHIALIAGILVSVLRVARVPRAWCGLVLIPLLWLYTAATGWQPSAIRSTLMMSLIIGGWALKRPTDLLNSLAAAALIILLWDPQQLFQASFQLSFFVVLSIALFMPPLEKIRDRLLQPDPFLPAELIPRWQRWLGKPLHSLATGLGTSLAAWLGAWPLTAYYFHLFSPVTLLANLVMIPLGSAALACNLGSLFCGAWFPWATEVFNHSGWLWMWLMMRISQQAVALPGAFFYVRSPGLADFLIYYALLLAVFGGFLFKPGRRRWAVVAGAGVILFYSVGWLTSSGTTEITVLPLNGGSAVYLRNGDDLRSQLIDCGNASAVEFVTIPFLQAQGLNRLDRLILTHGDIRHVGGFNELRGSLPVREIVTSSLCFRSTAYRNIIAESQSTPGRHLVACRGDRFGCWTVLHPDAGDRFTQADDLSLVLRGEISGIRLLLVSDLGRTGQESLLDRGGDLRADVVVTCLPDQSEPLCDPLLDAIRPSLIIVADSEYPATKRAGAALRERLERRGIPVVYTRQSGAVTLRIKERQVEVRTMSGLRWKSNQAEAASGQVSAPVGADGMNSSNIAGPNPKPIEE